jgi:hypothetical protein
MDTPSRIGAVEHLSSPRELDVRDECVSEGLARALSIPAGAALYFFEREAFE